MSNKEPHCIWVPQHVVDTTKSFAFSPAEMLIRFHTLITSSKFSHDFPGNVNILNFFFYLTLILYKSSCLLSPFYSAAVGISSSDIYCMILFPGLSSLICSQRPKTPKGTAELHIGFPIPSCYRCLCQIRLVWKWSTAPRPCGKSNKVSWFSESIKQNGLLGSEKSWSNYYRAPIHRIVHQTEYKKICAILSSCFVDPTDERRIRFIWILDGSWNCIFRVLKKESFALRTRWAALLKRLVLYLDN